MKITIDTKEDSHEEIKKIIKMLSSLVGEEFRTNQPNIFESADQPAPSGGVFGSLFDQKKEDKEDIPEVEEY